ncbi:MAG TPA: HAMP domain-containing sensor histidine kinase [Streptosporangiaceae bacterium]|nr:HAMP domain-containing sensor histidine kinase [Streptosporangiaceae bacterium]
MTSRRRPPILSRWRAVPGSVHAVRVALAASVLIGLVYAGCVVVLDVFEARRLMAAVDARLHERLADASAGHLYTQAGDDDTDEAPLFLWLVKPAQGAVPLSLGAPRPSTGEVAVAAKGPATIGLHGGQFRIAAVHSDSGVLVAGQSLAEQGRIEALLRNGEILAAPVLFLAVFIGALIIGLRALAPVERSRQRQLDFTADASHELRTPLSVISAETGIALRAERSPVEYQAALGRIQNETKRLRSIVDDLLWLARFDSAPPAPKSEPLDLATVARECADRFTAVAREGSFAISVEETAGSKSGAASISAPPEWISRLIGVLLDNACRYAGDAGQVRISVSQRGNRIVLRVEDSGPGLTAEQEERLFDRFHRSTGDGGGAGLGLAIADSIVSSTSGQWRIGRSDLGGALFEISWRC